MAILDLDTALRWRGNTLFLGSLPVARVKPPRSAPQIEIDSAKEKCETEVRKLLSEIAK